MSANQDNIPFFPTMTNGTNRSERVLPSLAPSGVKIDGHEIIDKVFYTLNLASNFQYFNISGAPYDTWNSLLKENVYFQLAKIYKYDVVKLIDDNEAAELFQDHLYGKGKGAIEKYLTSLTNKIDTPVGGDISQWISIFGYYQDKALDTFKLHLTTIKSQVSQINDTLNGILNGLKGDSITKPDELDNDISEIKDALRKLKRYFYSLSREAKDLFNSQLENDKNIAPHIALFLGFLQLYDSQRDQINSLTAEHLSYCYSKLLGIEKSPASPDSTYLVFKLADNPQLLPYTIEQGTKLDAGKYENDQTILFTTDTELIVTKTSVAEFKKLFISYLSQVADKKSFNLFALTDEQKEIAENALTISTSSDPDPQFTDENLGLIVASPVLFIEDGQVRFELTLTLTSDDSTAGFDTSNPYLESSPFSIYVTTASGWKKVSKYRFTIEGDQMVIKFGYDAVSSPITAYDKDVYPEQYLLDKPAIKINLHREDIASPYIALVNMVISKVDIKIKVDRSKKVRIQTALGLVGPGNPFQPFGPAPQPGSYFDMRNDNIFNKNLDSFKINIDWLGLPSKTGGFKTYYQKYNDGPFNVNFEDTIFKVNLGALKGASNSFSQLTMREDNDFPLFISEHGKLTDKGGIKADAVDTHLGFQNNNSLAAEKNLDFTRPGVVRLTLTAPDYGFGFGLFPSVLAYYVTLNNQKVPGWKIPSAWNSAKRELANIQPKDNSAILPNQPYIPVIKSIAVDYELSFSRGLNTARDSDDDQLTIMHIYPFGGYKTVYPNVNEKDYHLVPQFESGNSVFIRLDNFEGGGMLNLLFSLNEDVVENDFTPLSKVAWFYLKDNQWQSIGGRNIYSDSTDSFTKTGIVRLEVPADITSDNTLMPAGCWIMAGLKDDDPNNAMTRNLSIIVSNIQNNAASATRDLDEFPVTDPLTLKAASITQLVTRVPDIESVEQPLPSFGGVGAASDDSYYLSVSERLRHKARPISAWELERIVLDKFPEIRYVRCINFKTNWRNLPELNPRPDILVIVVGDDDLVANNSFRAPYDTLTAIKSYLTGIVSADLEIAVTNPHFERLRIKCLIEFENDNDQSKIKDFEQDFAAYLNPWQFDADKNVDIVSTVYLADILGFLKSRPYIKQIDNVVLMHLYEKGLAAAAGIQVPVGSGTELVDSTQYFLDETADNTPISTFLPYGMFVAAPPHILLDIDAEDKSGFQYAGISELTIDDDFRLGSEIPAAPPPEAINAHIAAGPRRFVIDI